MKIVCLDIETNGLSWRSRVLCVSAAVIDDDAMSSSSINLGMQDMFSSPVTIPEARTWVQGVLKGADWVVGHNLSFDIPYLVRDGLLESEQLQGRTFDSLIAARMTGSHQSAGLESLCDEFRIGFRDPEEESFYRKMKERRARLEMCGSDQVMRYCELDTVRNLRLALELMQISLEQYSEQRMRDEGDYVLAVSGMRIHGLPIDIAKIARTMDAKRKQLSSLNRILVANGIAGPNDRAGTLRFMDRFALRRYLTVTEKGNTSLKEETLLDIPGVKEFVDLLQMSLDETLDEKQDKILRGLTDSVYPQIITALLEAREIDKQISTWLQGFLDDADDRGLIHPLWGAGGTVSYRLNCTEPNAQAVTKKLSLWGTLPGYVRVEVDLQQAELRLGAAYAAENKMARMFADGIEFHTGTASEMYGVKDLSYFKTTVDGKIKRRNAKSGNFCGFYGGGAKALNDALHCGMSMAEKIVGMWRKTFPGVVKISKQAEKCWRERGYVILSHGKRLWASPHDLQHRIYKAFNQLVQGSIAEIIRVTIMRILGDLPGVIVVGQIHDSILMLVPVDLVEEYVPRIQGICESSTPEAVLRRTTPPIKMTVDMEIYGENGERIELGTTAMRSAA